MNDMVEIIELALMLLMITVLSTYLIILIIFYKNFKSYRVKITVITLIILVCFGAGSIYDFTWLFFCIFDINADSFPGKVGFCCKIILFLAALYYDNRLLTLYLKNADIKVKHDLYQKYFHLALIWIYSAIAIITIQKGPTDLFGYFSYMIDFHSVIILFFIFIAITSNLILKSIPLSKGIKNKKSRQKITIALFLFGYLTIERFFSISPIMAVFYNALTNLIVLSVNLVFIISVILILFKYPNILEEIGSLFSVKTVILFNKKGDLLLNYQLITSSQSRKNLLLGGFIQALTQSSKKEKIFDANINIVDFGDLKLIIKQGERTYGVLIVRNVSLLLQEKLEILISQFEGFHEKEYINWKADISSLNPDKTVDFIFELFH